MHRLSKKEPFKKYTIECNDPKQTVICSNNLPPVSIGPLMRFIIRVTNNETGAILFQKNLTELNPSLE